VVEFLVGHWFDRYVFSGQLRHGSPWGRPLCTLPSPEGRGFSR
jgi:hypothetical protein